MIMAIAAHRALFAVGSARPGEWPWGAPFFGIARGDEAGRDSALLVGAFAGTVFHRQPRGFPFGIAVLQPPGLEAFFT